MKRIYFDVCCWSRPFDDQTQTRIHLEAEAVLVILEKLETGNWQLVHSDVVDLEIDQTTDPERRRRLKASIPDQHHVVTLDATGIRRGKELESLGIPGLDALHLAAAEAGTADVFLTTDDQLLRLAVKHGKRLRVRVANPLTWLQDVVEEEL